MKHTKYIQPPERNDGFHSRMGRRAKLFTTVAVVALSGVAVLLYLRSDVYDLKRVAICGNAVVSSPEIMNLLPLGENLFSLDLDGVASRLGRHPYIASVFLQKVYPDKLIVRVNELSPACWLAEGPLQLLAGNGTVLPVYQTQILPHTKGDDAVTIAGFDLPVITSYTVDRRGELERYSDSIVRAASELCAEMQRQALPLFDELIEIRLTRDHLEGLLTDSSRILFPLNVSPAKLAALQAVYTRERQNGLIELDARYSRQIISRNRPP
ncbi:FtsQ-type POTRA domain-containing protein [bacterium]|nr:FtsQ-type POTRA domain-containing protein [bacterium]